MIDGDTLHVVNGNGAEERIRIGQVDAPERSQPFGDDARVCLARLVSDGRATICRDGVDAYGRTVANVVAGGEDVGRRLVAEGCAWAYRKYLEANSDLPALEDLARRQRLGLWSDEAAVAPWVYRSGTAPVTVDVATGSPAVLVLPSNLVSTFDRVFDWAEHEYPLLLRDGSANQVLPDGTIYRCYATHFCVGYLRGTFLTYDGRAITVAGDEASFVAIARSKGF